MLIVSQVAGPPLADLAEHLGCEGIRTAMLSGRVDAPPSQRRPYAVLPACRLRKSPAAVRLLTWSAFTARALGELLARPRTPALIVSNPPLPALAMPTLSQRRKAPYVMLVYDIYPDVAERLGLLPRDGRLARVWRAASRQAMLASAGVLTIGESMAETLRGHLQPGDAVDVDVIPNWADTDWIKPLPRGQNPFARRHGLCGKFVVMYSGNFGATHDMASVIAAAGRLTDLADVRFVLIGGGTREKEVSDMVRRAKLPNLALLPFQPRDELPYSLASADCSIVCLDAGYEGLSVPSKTYYALAAGSALLAIGQDGSELHRLVRRYKCGLPLQPRRPDQLAAAVRKLYAERGRLVALQTAARQAAVQHFSREHGCEACRRYLQERLDLGDGQARLEGVAECAGS